MGLSKRLSENRRAHRAADPTAAYHAKQIANMQRRIANQNTLTERKKNVYDTTRKPRGAAPKTAGRPPPWGFSSDHLSVGGDPFRPPPSARTSPDGGTRPGRRTRR